VEQRQYSSAGEATTNGLVQGQNNQEDDLYRMRVLNRSYDPGQHLVIIPKGTSKVISTTVTPEASQTSATLTPRITSPVFTAVSVRKETGLKMTSSSEGSADNTPVPMDQVDGAGTVLHLKSSLALSISYSAPFKIKFSIIHIVRIVCIVNLNYLIWFI
jgi:hypothetical protein